MLTTEINETLYQKQLDKKLFHLRKQLAAFTPPKLEVFSSPIKHFRMRVEFRVWHEGDQLYYVMFDKQTKKPIKIHQFPYAATVIDQIMMPLLKTIEKKKLLSHKLFQMDFLSNQAGELLVTLIYHKPLDVSWETEAKKLKEEFNVHLIGRSHKQKICLDQDYLDEKFLISGKSYYYRQTENTFTQPNADICQKMLSWTLGVAKTHCQKDLLELYCGHGNFTCVLASHFDQVFATEIAKASILGAQHNMAQNKIDNITLARLSAEECRQALNFERPFRRLKKIDLKQFQFDTLFVDPPRSGLDEQTANFAQKFEHIIYISCGLESLKNNLKTLAKTHNLTKLALFDQFPYTNHLEIGVFLTKK